MSVAIRRATEADLPRIVELLQQLTLDEPREDVADPLPAPYRAAFARIDGDPAQHLLVAERDGRVVGTLVVVLIPNLSHRAKPWAVAENVVVDGEARGRGVGEALLREATTIARRAGCFKLSLTSNKARSEAHRFYGRLGFRATHEGFRIDL
jgi:GNAT superfamily N-acetyltransferase